MLLLAAALLAADLDTASTGAVVKQLPTMVIKVDIDPEGKVSACGVDTPIGNPTFDVKSCEIAVRRFHFKPAMLDGRPVASTKNVPIHWSVDDSRAK